MKRVEVYNQTREMMLLESAELADSIFSRMKGLLGRSGLAAGQGMVLKPANSIHTVGMKFSLDVLFVDRGGTVLRVIENMSPGRAGVLVRKSVYVIEMAAGELKKTGTAVGDKLTFSPGQQII